MMKVDNITSDNDNYNSLLTTIKLSLMITKTKITSTALSIIYYYQVNIIIVYYQVNNHQVDYQVNEVTTDKGGK